MKKSNIIYASIVGSIILAIILYFSLRHTEGDGHVHTEGETHTEESHSDEKEPTAIKEVELKYEDIWAFASQDSTSIYLKEIMAFC